MKPYQTRKSGHIVGILLPLGLICLFAFCSLALALMGGGVYREIQQENNENYGAAVSSSYLRSKLTQNNAASGVALRPYGGQNMLVISTTSNYFVMETRIFLHEGQLVEQYAPADDAVDPGAATVIAQLKACTFTIDESGLFTAELTALNGQRTRTAVALVGGDGT